MSSITMYSLIQHHNVMWNLRRPEAEVVVRNKEGAEQGIKEMLVMFMLFSEGSDNPAPIRPHLFLDYIIQYYYY